MCSSDLLFTGIIAIEVVSVAPIIGMLPSSLVRLVGVALVHIRKLSIHRLICFLREALITRMSGMNIVI